VRRLVLMSTNTGWGSMPAHPRAFAHLFSVRRLQDPMYYAEIAPELLGGRMRRDPELALRAARARATEDPDVLGYWWQLLGCATWSTLPFLPLIRQPTLFVNGDDDPLARLSNARWMVRLMPHARLHVLEGAGHHLLFEQPAELGALVRAFVGDNEAR
jgi:pimeloyl-ACP methyl ester carboxylesterase